MTASVPLSICSRAFQGGQLASEIECKRADAHRAAAITDIGARLRTRAMLRCGGLNEANCAVHTALWRLLRRSVDLAAISENDLEATLNEIWQT